MFGHDRRDVRDVYGSVAEYRGLKQQAVIDTQAGLYFGPGAVSAGRRMKSLTPGGDQCYRGKVYATPSKTSIQMQAAAMDLQTKM
nr:hypothetical protein [Klebsiella pneumoniae]